MSEIREIDSLPVVWEATVDNDTFAVKVRRIKPYEGVLVIKKIETNELVYVEMVTISYGAPFGPDMGDVEDWKSHATEAIDEFVGKSPRTFLIRT
jgi:hypothetical protein